MRISTVYFHYYYDPKSLKQATFIIMHHILRENSLYQHIKLVQLAQMPHNEEELIYLYDLQGLIDL
jgi:hypothetical protein